MVYFLNNIKYALDSDYRFAYKSQIGWQFCNQYYNIYECWGKSISSSNCIKKEDNGCRHLVARLHIFLNLLLNYHHFFEEVKLVLFIATLIIWFFLLKKLVEFTLTKDR